MAMLTALISGPCRQGVAVKWRRAVVSGLVLGQRAVLYDSQGVIVECFMCFVSSYFLYFFPVMTIPSLLEAVFAFSFCRTLDRSANGQDATAWEVG